MNNKVKFASLMVAAMASQSLYPDGVNVFSMGSNERRRKHGRRKGGGHGVGIINGLPKSSKYIAKKSPRRQCGNRNLEAWERAAA